MTTTETPRLWVGEQIRETPPGVYAWANGGSGLNWRYLVEMNDERRIAYPARGIVVFGPMPTSSTVTEKPNAE